MLLTLLVSSVCYTPLPLEQDLARFAPADAMVTLIGTDLEGMRGRADSNAWWQLVRDPAFHQVWSEARQSDWMNEFTGEGDLDPIALLNSGFRAVDDFACFVSLPKGLRGVAVVTLLVRGVPGDSEAAAAIDLLVAAALGSSEVVRETAGALGGSVMHTDGLSVFQGGGLSAFVFTSEEAPELLGDSFAALLTALADPSQAAVGGGDRLIDTPAFRASRASADLALEVFVNLARVVEGLIQIVDLPDEGIQVLEETGLTEMGYLHLAADVGAGENLDFVARLDVGANTALDRIFSMLGQADVGQLALLPAEAVAVEFACVDIVQLFDEMLNMAEEFDPSGEEVKAGIDLGMMMAEMTLGVGVTEVLDYFTGQFGSYSMLLSAEEIRHTLGQGVEVTSILGQATFLQLTDGEAFELLISDLMTAKGEEFGLEFETKEVHGCVIHLAPSEGSSETMAWAILGDMLVFSAFPSSVYAAARVHGQEGAPNAAGNDVFDDLDRIAVGAFSIGVADSKAMAKQVLAALDLFSSMGLDGLDLDGPVDQAGTLQWPDASIVGGYLGGRITSRAVRVGSLMELSVRAR